MQSLSNLMKIVSKRDGQVLSALCLALVLSSLAWGQTPAEQPSSSAQETRHSWLRVTTDRVNIRSRADLNSQIVGRASQGDVLESTGIDSGWYAIIPPPGVFSLVASQFIERVDDTHGRVEVDTSLRVRVGSDIQPYDPMLCEVQTHLQRGAEVEILGSVNTDWLKIKPPAGVHVYISGQFAEEISEEEARRLNAIRVAEDNSEVAEPTQAEVVLELPPATQPGEVTDLSKPWGVQLAEVQKEIEQLGRAEDQQRDWSGILEKLSSIARQTEEPEVAALAGDWLKRVEQQAQEEQASAVATQTMPEKPAPAEEAKTAELTVKVRQDEQPRKTDQQFDAMGTLRVSYALPVGPFGLRYRLLNPSTKKVVAYIEIPSELGVNIKDCLDKYVGVKGAPFELQDPKVTIMRVTQLTILDPKAVYRETP